MIEIPFLTGLRRVLCLGAHSDDIEIGAGGTLLRLISEDTGIEVYWVVFSAPGVRAGEAYASAGEYLAPLKDKTIKISNFRESYFPTQWDGIKTFLEGIRAEFDPDLVLTHTREDRHQDHRVLSDLAWNTFRNHLVLEYEILKYDGDLGRPNVYVPLSPPVAERKVEWLMKHFQSQTSKHWFKAGTFAALARIRGVECAALYAEAFYGRKIVF